MNLREERICRLCLRVAKKEFGKVNEPIKQIWEVLLLKLDLDIIREPIICSDCVEVAKKYLLFKSTYISTELIILAFSTGRKNAKFNIKVIYKEKEHVMTFNDEDLDICRFCLARMERNSFVPLETLLNESVFEMLTTYMPEVDFNTIESPMICTTCREHLEGYCKFVLNCVGIERNLKAYCKKEGIESMSQSDVLHLLLCRDIVHNPEKCPQIKKESNMSEYTEHLYPEELIKVEEFNGEEETNFKEDTYQILSEVKLDEYDMFSKDNDKRTKSDITSLETRTQNTEGYTDQKPTAGNIMDTVAETVSERKIYKCSLCAFKSKYKNSLKRHMLVHRDLSEIKMYKCSSCAYETKHKSYFKTHMLVHTDVSKIKMFKCSLCAHECKHKGDLRKHVLTHKGISQIKMYKCALCAYEAKVKGSLRRHMLVHKDVSEIKMYKCPLCAYSSKLKSNLKMHELIHKDASEINMYKCLLCSYEARQKKCIETHMLVHKEASELIMYECSSCTYKSKYKTSLQRHMLVHKDISEIKMYKCSCCSYECNSKGNLRKHMVVHKDVSEIRMFKCSLCTYESKRKGGLNNHMLVHKDVTEIKMFKCSLCAYEAKQKYILSRHMIVHKNDSNQKHAVKVVNV